MSEFSNWLRYQFLLSLKQLPLPTQGVSFPWETLNGQKPGFPVEHMCYFLSKWCFCLDKSPASPRSETTYVECKRKDGPSYSQQSFWELLSLESHGGLLSKCLSADHPAELAWLWLSCYSPNSACGGIRLKFQNFTTRDRGSKSQLSPSPGSTLELLAIMQQTTVSLTLSSPPLFLREKPPNVLSPFNLE